MQDISLNVPIQVFKMNVCLIFLGQGIYGQTTAGLQFYRGTKYPSRYINKLFALEFSQNWIRVIDVGSGDIYQGIQNFADLNGRVGAKVTLLEDHEGNICYITMNGGEVICFKYVATNVAPTPVPTAKPASGPAPLTVQFSADGTFDRENDQLTLLWNFGNGITSTQSNPQVCFTCVNVLIYPSTPIPPTELTMSLSIPLTDSITKEMQRLVLSLATEHQPVLSTHPFQTWQDIQRLTSMLNLELFNSSISFYLSDLISQIQCK